MGKSKRGMLAMPGTAFVYDRDMVYYDFGPGHPLRPERLARTYELVSECELLGGESRLVLPTPADEGDILSFHTPEYLNAVKQLSLGMEIATPWRFGFGYGDNPPFPGMYEASLLYTGASLMAADMVIGGEVERTFNISGGLHHAMPGKASGFCIFNDPVIAINRLRRRYGRIAYIDIDAHHGDGVQEAFYSTDQVLTISLHESGEYLFPGSGFAYEIGEGKGRGFSVNVPLAPSTGDEVYLWAFGETVPPLISAYEPDVIVAQLGADTHFDDPLTDLCLTSRGFMEAVKTIIGFGKPLVALGGGGYSLSAVPRLWTLAFAEMAGRKLPDDIPERFARAYGLYHLHDRDAPQPSPGQEHTAREFAERTIRTLKELVFPFHPSAHP